MYFKCIRSILYAYHAFAIVNVPAVSTLKQRWLQLSAAPGPGVVKGSSQRRHFPALRFSSLPRHWHSARSGRECHSRLIRSWSCGTCVRTSRSFARRFLRRSPAELRAPRVLQLNPLPAPSRGIRCFSRLFTGGCLQHFWYFCWCRLLCGAVELLEPSLPREHGGRTGFRASLCASHRPTWQCPTRAEMCFSRSR